jgi:hypothetical protein
LNEANLYEEVFLKQTETLSANRQIAAIAHLGPARAFYRRRKSRLGKITGSATLALPDETRFAQV